MILEGNVSVKAAIMAGNRDVHKLYMATEKHDRDSFFIMHRAIERGIEVVRCPREEIDALAEGRTHGGLIAEAGERRYQEISDCLSDMPFVALAEGVEDPFNLGYLMRSLHSAGCTGILLRMRDWSNVEQVILKASAGAFDWMNVVLCEDLPGAVKSLRNQGLYCYAAMRKDAISYLEADFRRPVLVGIGGEMRGLSSKVLKEMDQNICVPYANDFRNALNAAAAAAVIGFEVFRQRMQQNPAMQME